MVSVGQVVDVNGKPQIVEKVFQGGYVSRAPEPGELDKRSIPESVANTSHHETAPPVATPQQVEVVGGIPAAKDEAAMYAQGYEYKGQKGNEQIWVKWNTPRAPGTQTSAAGDTWQIENATQKVIKGGKPVATFFGQDIYYSTSAPSNEGKLPEQQMASAATGKLGAPIVNPFNKNQLLSTSYAPAGQSQQVVVESWYNNQDEFVRNYAAPFVVAGSPYGFEYAAKATADFLSGSPFETASQKAEKKSSMDAFVKTSYYNLIHEPDDFKLVTEYVLSSPGGIAAQGLLTGMVFKGASSAFSISGDMAAASEGAIARAGLFKGATIGMGAAFLGSAIYNVAEGYKTQGTTGALKPVFEATTFIAGAKVGEEIIESNFMKGVKERIYREEIKTQSPDSKTAILDPNANKSPFTIESESYAVKTRTYLGRIKTNEIIDVTKSRTIGTIEKTGETTSTITGGTATYNLNPKTGIENIDVSKITGKVETKTLFEKEGGLKTTLDKMKILEESEYRKSAGAFSILNKELFSGKSKYNRKTTFSTDEIVGSIVEGKDKGTHKEVSLKFLKEGELSTKTEFRQPSLFEGGKSREIDLIKTKKQLDAFSYEKTLSFNGKISKAGKAEPDWMFNEKQANVRKRIMKIDTSIRDIYAKPRPEPVINKPINAETPAGTTINIYEPELNTMLMKQEMLQKPHTGILKGITLMNEKKIADIQKPAINAKTNAHISSSPYMRMIMTMEQQEQSMIPSMRMKMMQKFQTYSIENPFKMSMLKTQTMQRLNTRQSLDQELKIGTMQIQKLDVAQMQGTQTMQEQQLTTQQTITTPRIKMPHPNIPRANMTGTGFFISMPKGGGGDFKKGSKTFGFKLGKVKSKYKKRENLMPSPIQADVSKALYGKATAPKPTRAVLSRATFSTPTAEQLRHRK